MHATGSFNITIDLWIAFLDSYSLNQLQKQPSVGSWSMGQLYMHIISDTNFYIDKMKEAVLDKVSLDEEIHADALEILDKGFPDAKIEGHPSNAFIHQPSSKEELLIGLNAIKNEVNKLCTEYDLVTVKGKSDHPGLKFFTVEQWIRFADVHMQHHFRQKKRIDQFLSS